jgi:hypothetical protein
MSHQSGSDDDLQPPTAGPGSDHAGAPAPMSRRRLILKTLGKGSAVVAASVPLKTLAGTSSVLPNGQLCSISGVQSATHSATPSLPTCGGLSPGYYSKLSKWPYYNKAMSPKCSYSVSCSRGMVMFNENTAFSAVFQGGSTKTLKDIMTTTPNNEDEFHWIPALLNAIKAPAGYVFPYSPGEVIDMYASAQHDNALSFFKNYMEKV